MFGISPRLIYVKPVVFNRRAEPAKATMPVVAVKPKEVFDTSWLTYDGAKSKFSKLAKSTIINEYI